MTHRNRSRRFGTVLKLALAVAALLLVSGSSDAARLCENKKGKLKVREACNARETDQGGIVLEGGVSGFVTREEVTGMIRPVEDVTELLGHNVASLGEEISATAARAGSMGKLKIWNLHGNHQIASNGNKTGLFTTVLPPGKWLIGGKIDVVHKDVNPVLPDPVSYRCELLQNGTAFDESAAFISDDDHNGYKEQSVTLFTFMDWHEPVTLQLNCFTDQPAVGGTHVGSGRFWAVSMADFSEF